MRAVLSTGSNMGDPRSHLASVRDDFSDELVAESSLYSTPPWGGVDQDDFINQILIVEVDQDPLELLERCQRLEAAAQRVRELRWGPRTLDVDIVALYESDESTESGALRIDVDKLTVPHPRAHERAFVLVPWSEIDPQAELNGEHISDVIASLPAEDVSGVVKL